MKQDGNSGSRSYFSSLAGILILTVLSILSAYFRFINLTVFLLAVLAIGILSFVWGKLSLRSVEVDAHSISCNVFPDENIQFRLEASNGKVLPVLWIDIRYFDEKPNFLADDVELTRHVTWLLPKQSASWTAEFRAHSRGVSVMQSVMATSGDGFGLCSETREYALSEPAMIVVYPRVFAVDTDPLIRMNSGLLASDQGCMEDNTFFKGIHDYHYGDSTRNINWRVLAAQGKLAVNEYQPVVPRLVTFVLDLMSFTSWREEVNNAGVSMVLDHVFTQELEDMISLTASCILSLTRKKVCCTLVLPALGGKDLHIVEGNGREEQVPLLLTELAGLEYNGEECFFQGLARASFGMGQIHLVCKDDNPSKQLDCEVPGASAIVRTAASDGNGRRMIRFDQIRRSHEGS